MTEEELVDSGVVTLAQLSSNPQIRQIQKLYYQTRFQSLHHQSQESEEDELVNFTPSTVSLFNAEVSAEKQETESDMSMMAWILITLMSAAIVGGITVVYNKVKAFKTRRAFIDNDIDEYLNVRA